MQQRKLGVGSEDSAVDWGYHCGILCVGSERVGEWQPCLGDGVVYGIGSEAGRRGEGDAVVAPQRVDPLGRLVARALTGDDFSIYRFYHDDSQGYDSQGRRK